jgi:serine/threonine-protein kinase
VSEHRPSLGLTDCLDENLVYGFVRGSLTEAAARGVARHSEQCEECRQLIIWARQDQLPDAEAVTELGRRAAATDGSEARALLDAFEPQREDLSGQLLAGKYRLDRRLGSGGMGVVYEALNTWADRRVAVKLLHRAFSRDPETINRFVREAKSANRVKHPSIVDVLDLGRDPSDGSLYMVQELLEGDTLRQRIRAKTHLSIAEAIAIMVPVMDALASAHDAGVVHRDVKPENIVLSVDRVGKEVPKLIDFGISKITVGEVTALVETGRAIGTPLYMSPEQLRANETIDGRSDVWAVGVVLFELLAGQRPFDGASHNDVVVKILTIDAPLVSSVAANVPQDVARVIARALARDRDARFPTVRELHDAFVACATLRREAPIVTAPTQSGIGTVAPPPKARRPKRVIYAAAVGALAVALAGSRAALHRPTTPLSPPARAPDTAPWLAAPSQPPSVAAPAQPVSITPLPLVPSGGGAPPAAAGGASSPPISRPSESRRKRVRRTPPKLSRSAPSSETAPVPSKPSSVEEAPILPP